MAITPLLVDQIEKFQCLELSSAQGLSPGVLTCCMLHVYTWTPRHQCPGMKFGQFEIYLHEIDTIGMVFRHLSYCYLTVYIYTYMYVYIYLLNEQVKNHKRLRRMSNIIGKSRSILVY